MDQKEHIIEKHNKEEEIYIIKSLQKINERLDNLIIKYIDKRYPKIDYIKSLQDNDEYDE